MLITINKNEFKSMEETFRAIGLESIKLEKALGLISECENSYYVDSFELPIKLSDEEIEHINETYGIILRIKITEDEYSLWINPEFVTDYVVLYKDITVGFIDIIGEIYKKVKFLVKPLIKSFASKWNIEIL